MSRSPNGRKPHRNRIARNGSARNGQAAMSSERAALESVSPTLLMPGEDPSSPYLPDAEHWMAVYGELYGFTVAILNRFREMVTLQQPAQDYLRTHDMVVHQEQIARFAERLAFWNRRVTQLQAAARRR